MTSFLRASPCWPDDATHLAAALVRVARHPLGDRRRRVRHGWKGRLGPTAIQHELAALAAAEHWNV
eukprot:7591213-Pyramimonas_sp.AAC.1